MQTNAEKLANSVLLSLGPEKVSIRCSPNRWRTPDSLIIPIQESDGTRSRPNAPSAARQTCTSGSVPVARK